MNFLTYSSLALVIVLGTVWGVLKVFPTEFTALGAQSPRDSVILDDVPPPDDTYTPDHRRHS